MQLCYVKQQSILQSHIDMKSKWISKILCCLSEGFNLQNYYLIWSWSLWLKLVAYFLWYDVGGVVMSWPKPWIVDKNAIYFPKEWCFAYSATAVELFILLRLLNTEISLIQRAGVRPWTSLSSPITTWSHTRLPESLVCWGLMDQGCAYNVLEYMVMCRSFDVFQCYTRFSKAAQAFVNSFISLDVLP